MKHILHFSTHWDPMRHMINYKTSLMVSWHLFRQWLGVIRQQAIIWVSVDTDLCLCHHTASPSHKEFNSLMNLRSRLTLDEESTLIQVMAWCCQAKSHYLSQCWPRSVSRYGVSRPQWVNILIVQIFSHSFVENLNSPLIILFVKKPNMSRHTMTVVQSSAVITQSNLSRYYIWYCDDSSRMQITLHSHNRHPIAHPHRGAMRCLMIMWLLNQIDGVTMAPHCVWLHRISQTITLTNTLENKIIKDDS